MKEKEEGAMNKPLIAVLIVALIVIIGVGAYFGHRPTVDNTATAHTTTNTTSPSVQQQTPVATDKVSIKNFSFSPPDITVQKGATVTWTNNDSTTHTITESDGQKGPSSGDLTPGSSYSFTYTAPGIYPYHCAIHSNMLGTVVVTN